MGVIAELSLDQSEFALGAAVAAAAGMHIELDRVLPAANEGTPYLWVSGGDFGAFEEAVTASETVRSLERVDVSGDTALYRVEWAHDTESLIRTLARRGVAVIEGVRVRDRWQFRLRFETHEDLSSFNKYCTDQGIDFELERVYSDADRDAPREAFDLTPVQADTLRLALERGYFQVPRQVTLEELGAELGISPQATSERIRRATDTVLSAVLASEPAPRVLAAYRS